MNEDVKNMSMEVVLAWEILYGDKLEELPDPNQPENTAYINAKAHEERQRFKNFIEGVGAPLVEKWAEKIRSDNLALFANPEIDKCSCSSCLILREIRSVFKLLIEAETIIRG